MHGLFSLVSSSPTCNLVMRTHNVTVLLVDYNDRNAFDGVITDSKCCAVSFPWSKCCGCRCSCVFARHGIPTLLPTHSSLEEEKKRHTCTGPWRYIWLLDITKCRAYFTLTFLYCRLLCDLPHVLLSSL